MSRFSRWVWFVVTWRLLIAGVVCGETARPSDTLLPKTTVGFVSATNYDDLQAHWKQTQVGKLVADPVMEPFEKDFSDQVHKHWTGVSERLGITLEDLKGVPAGEAALALIEPKPGEAATAMLLDITGRLAQAQAAVAKARVRLLTDGAKESRMTIGGAAIYIFDLQPAKEDQAAASQDSSAAVATAEPARQTIYFISQNLLGASDNLSVVQEIVTRLAQKSQVGSLAEVPGYQMVMKRCAADADDVAPQVHWFVYPLGYAEAVRAATPKEKRRRGKTVLEVMRHQGFGAIQGVGGYLSLASNGYEMIHRTAIYAPAPYTKSMKMFVLPNHEDFTPQAWVPRDIATYTTIYVDILNAFDNFGPLYDEMVGEEGVWAQTLAGMIGDPYGPQLDLRKELIGQLGQRVTMISDYKLPITTTSERLLWAIEAKDEKAVAKAIEKSMKNDPTAKKRVVDGHVVWEIVEEEQPKVPSISLDVPSLTPKKETKKAPKDPTEEEEEKEAHFLPHGAITVANGQLLVASHIDFLLKILKPVEEANMLRNNAEFQKVWETVDKKLGLKGQCVREFSFTDEEFRPTYELIRQGKMPESESLLGRALNTISGAAKKGTMRQQRISGKNLPEYDVVRRSLGPGAVAVSSETDGWFIKGILTKR